MEIFKIKKILDEITKKKFDINLDTKLKSIGIDSLEGMELLMLIEQEYNILLEDDIFDFVDTVRDLINEIERNENIDTPESE